MRIPNLFDEPELDDQLEPGSEEPSPRDVADYQRLTADGDIELTNVMPLYVLPEQPQFNEFPSWKSKAKVA